MRLVHQVELIDPGTVAASDQIARVPLPELTPAGISAACRTSTAKYLGLGNVSGAVDAVSLQQAVHQLETDEADIVLLPLNGYEWLQMLADLPSTVLTRVPHVFEGSLAVLRRDQLQLSVARRGPDDGIRRILTRLADVGHRFHVRSSEFPAAAPFAAFAPPPMVPGERRQSISELEQFLEFDPKGVAPVRSREDLTALRAGLFQLHDALEQSHALSQSIEGRGRRQAGDYWHAIMHRREPDYANARYWYRHVGAHPIHGELAFHASRAIAASSRVDVAHWRSRLRLPGRWDSLAFVDLCEQAAADESGPLAQVARRIQWTEMLLLLKATSQDAFGEAIPDSPRIPPKGHQPA
jgi:hypothetical protein